MEVTIYEWYTLLIIPGLVGAATSILYAMFISNKKFHPHKVYNEEGEVVAYYIGWIGHLLAGVFGAMLLNSLFFEISSGIVSVVLRSIIGALLVSKYIEKNWDNRD